MPLQIIRSDITKLPCDAIVNAANSTLLGGGGVDGAIHKAAGKGLLFECMKLGGCKTGQAKITGGYKLPCSYVIHTVGPKWKGGNNGEQALLTSCYRESLKLALEHGCKSVAFPLISSGVYGYPKEQALRVAVDTITAFLIEHDMLVYIVVFDKSSFQISEKLFADIASFIDDKYVDTHFEFNRTRRNAGGESTVLGTTEILSSGRPDSVAFPSGKLKKPGRSLAGEQEAFPSQTVFPEQTVFPGLPEFPKPEVYPGQAEFPVQAAFPGQASISLEDALKGEDESFSQALLRIIDAKGMTDTQCYKKANVDRKLFSKIRSDVHYHPRKTTAIAFAIALELSLEETKDLLLKAGFALSHSSKFDIIIEYFITNGNYNIFEINEALFAFDQALLGT